MTRPGRRTRSVGGRSPDGRSPGEEIRITRTLTFVMAVACGVAVACIYVNQPLVGLLEQAFPRHPALVRQVSTATQLGYAAGLLSLVPLGDIVERRRLILGQTAVLALALALAAAAPDAATLVAASVLIGVAASLAQQIIPFAAELAAPEHRGRTVGTVMSGLLAGILLGRVVAGIVGHHAGWRAVFGLAVGLVAASFVLLAWILPRRPPVLPVRFGALPARWGALLASLAALWRDEPALRTATVTQGALFASFIVFWTTLTLELDRAYGLGAEAAGLFGLVGVAGALLAPVVGHSADRRGPHVVIRMAIVVILLSWLILAMAHGVALLMLGVLLLDLGVQGAMVSHQHVIYALRAEARGRLNTVFVGGMFLGGALGSSLAALAWDHGGWHAVCAFGAFLGLVAFARQARTVRRAGGAVPHA